jgi:hypothetical protein
MGNQQTNLSYTDEKTTSIPDVEHTKFVYAISVNNIIKFYHNDMEFLKEKATDFVKSKSFTLTANYGSNNMYSFKEECDDDNNWKCTLYSKPKNTVMNSHNIIELVVSVDKVGMMNEEDDLQDSTNEEETDSENEHSTVDNDSENEEEFKEPTNDEHVD